jgi:perosamine synthetase
MGFVSPTAFDDDLIPLFKPSYGIEEGDAVKIVLESGWVGLGPKTQEFEKEFAKYIGSPYVAALNSGTAALHLAMLALNLKQGDEVLVSPITFVSTVHAIVYAGAKPVFVDVEEDTLNMDVTDLREKVGENTKAVIPMHYGGHPCDLDAIQEIAQDHRLSIVEDAAHACGALYRGRKIGSISRITCFSFHAVKNLACGEGGAVAFQESNLDRFFKQMRWLGITKDTWARTLVGETYAWQYWVDKLGYKYHMHDISAAIGLVQLRKLERNNLRRRELVEKYKEQIGDLNWLQLPVEKEYARSSWHIFHIKVQDEKTRNALIDHLKKDRISPGVHYYPINMHPFYQTVKSKVPVAEKIWKRIISLPMFPDMTEKQFERVVGSLRGFSPPG